MPQNPFRDPAVKPTWAQLSRLAGDRAAIRFEDLRKRVGAIAGIREDLHFFGSEWGWAPRYCVEDMVLFVVRILPGSLEGTVELDAPLREKILKSRVAGGIKEAVRRAPVRAGVASASFLLSTMRDIHLFARVVLMKSKVLRGGLQI